MTDRLKAMRRILKVQDQLKRSADWRLAEAERVAADLTAARMDLGIYLDRGDVLGPLAIVAVAQLQRLDLRGVAAGQVVAAEAEAMREATARQKLVGRAVEDLAREEAALRERKDLERLIEGFVARAGTAEHGGAE